MKKRLRIILTFLIYFLLLYSIPISSYAESKESAETIRVAYFDLGNYYKERTDGSIESYDSAYLDMVTQYTGLNFEYVNCGTWNQALAMLNNHEVDLIGTMQWTEEREHQYDICDASYGYTVAELASLSSADYIYEDYEGMNGATVGYMDGYVIENQLKDMMDEKGLTFKLKTYLSQQELDQALESGEIDLIAANAHAIHNDWKLIEKFDYAPNWTVVNKKDTIYKYIFYGTNSYAC